ncbi:MAG: ARPP-1 family domain-containing protein, partial [Phycisphaerales bacterium]
SRRAQWMRQAAAERDFRDPAGGASSPPTSPASDHAADQHVVWNMIAQLDSMSGAHSRSRDLIASMDLVQEASDQDIDAMTAAGRCGLVVFMHGHFVGADVFGDPAWYAASERHLLRSAFAMRRYGPILRARDRRDCADSLGILAESVLRDASHGAWVDGRPIGIERTATLVHPYLEAACSRTEDGRLLHLQLSTVAGLASILN